MRDVVSVFACLGPVVDYVNGRGHSCSAAVPALIVIDAGGAHWEMPNKLSIDGPCDEPFFYNIDEAWEMVAAINKRGHIGAPGPSWVELTKERTQALAAADMEALRRFKACGLVS